jgi:hypothetical protein
MHPYHHALSSQRAHGGATADYLPLHNWFDASKSSLAGSSETATWFGDARHFAMRHHSFRIFHAEQRFGVVLAQSLCPIPTRVAAEWHVRTVLGRIPAAADFLRRIKGQPWMAAAHKARRRGLCDGPAPAEAAPQNAASGEPHDQS